MTVTEIKDLKQFETILADAKGKLVVVDFTATWCGPCRIISPVFHELAESYKGRAIFCKCDVDAAKTVATQEKISAMPTFIFYVNKQRIDEICGANAAGLKQKVGELVAKYSVFASSGGHSLLSGSGNASSSSKIAEKAPARRVNPWADPNFVPPGMRQSTPSSGSAKTEAKPAPESKSHGPKTPWSDPSFLPKPTETTPKPTETTSKSPAPQKPADTADADLAKAIAMSLDDGQPAPEAANDPSLVAKINQNLLSELLDMGFPRIRAEKSLILTNAKTMEAATNWLIEHEQDADIDEPLTVVGTASSKADEMFDDEDDGLSDAIRSVREKAAKAKEEARKQALDGQESVDMSKMTKEEKLAYIERLKTVRKAQREKQEREEARQREIERQQNIKAAQEAKRAREEQQAAMAAARAKREKEAERARQKRIEEKLKADKEARIKAKLEREQKAKAASSH